MYTLNVKRTIVFVLLVAGTLVVPFSVVAQFQAGLEEVDDILDAENPDRAIALLEQLESDAASDQERGEVYWRMSSAILMRGDQRKDAGASENELLSIFEEGERFGQRAIDADSSNHLGYYWKSANIGRWGQTKGVLNSLFRAPDMRDLLTQAVTRDPEHAESYYVLGQLYAKVPGVVSFGNTEYAVSLARKSVDLMESELASGERDERNEAFYVQLASHLIDRGWNQRQRDRKLSTIRRNFQGASDPIERGFYYEGAIDVPSIDDTAEAEEILDEVVGRLERLSSPSPSELRQLREAEELIAGL